MCRTNFKTFNITFLKVNTNPVAQLNTLSSNQKVGTETLKPHSGKSTMLNLARPFLLCSLLLLYLSGATQGTTEVLTLHNPKTSLKNPNLAVSVSYQDLNDVANSVLMAETWLRTHVLPYYPAAKITHIVVGHNVLCFSQTHRQAFHHVLPALKNLHYSLTRWGLDTEIEVSPSLSSQCLTTNLDISIIKPVIEFIQAKNSTYLINSVLDPKVETLFASHLEFLKKVGFSSIGKMNLVVETPKEAKPTMRKLAFVVPPMPTPSPNISPALNFPIAKEPLPPLVGPLPSLPSPLGLSPAHSPHPHHHPHLLPPCNPWAGSSPPRGVPGPVSGEKLWCVAKPSVPAEILQGAMDYACGEGGGECHEIQPDGNCYYPDTVMAHASFAFNNYWQKTKRIGGTCSFGGTAMLINSDPSFLHCKFIVS